MENRERDRVSQRTVPTEAGELNRHVEEKKGRESNMGTSAEFGQKIGRSENLESGELGSDGRTEDRGSRNEVGSTGSSEGRH